MGQVHLGDGVRCSKRLQHVELGGLSRHDVAEAACPGALVAENHESGRPHSPTLEDVGTPRLFAHGVQVESAHHLLQIRVFAVHPGCHPHPFGSRRLARQTAVHQHRFFGAFLRRERAGCKQTIDLEGSALFASEGA